MRNERGPAAYLGSTPSAAEVRFLQTISGDINATLDIDEIFDVVLRAMDELFGFDHWPHSLARR